MMGGRKKKKNPEKMLSITQLRELKYETAQCNSTTYKPTISYHSYE